MPPPGLKGLYLIAGSGLGITDAADWLLPGVCAVQYRNKRANHATRLKEAAQLCALCRERNVWFIVNDDADLAAAVGADGVHLGKNDLEIPRACDILGEKSIIGVSCYDSIERALAAQRDGADYVSFGSLFVSRTKPEAVRMTPAKLVDYKRRLDLPVCAIGGITPENIESVLAGGADLVAVNAAVAGATDRRTAVKNLIDRVNRHA